MLPPNQLAGWYPAARSKCPSPGSVSQDRILSLIACGLVLRTYGIHAFASARDYNACPNMLGVVIVGRKIFLVFRVDLFRYANKPSILLCAKCAKIDAALGSVSKPEPLK